jgi:preprotein translocase subunit SecE
MFMAVLLERHRPACGLTTRCGDLMMARGATRGKRGNFVVRFLRETRSEVRKVIWPTRREALNMTAIVLGVTILMAAGLGLVDWLFSKLFAFAVR